MIATQNSIYSMDKSSKINPKKILGTIATVLVTADLWMYSQSNQMKSPIESSLRMFPYLKNQEVVTYPTITPLDNQKPQEYYYLRGSAANFACDDHCNC